MKKLLLAAAASAALASSAAAMDGMFVSVKGGWVKPMKVSGGTVADKVGNGAKHKDKTGANRDAAVAAKGKSKSNAFAAIAVGYKISDEFRAELELARHFDMKFTSKVSGAVSTDDAAKPRSWSTDAKVKTGVTSLMLRGTYDVYDFGMAKLHVSAGVGMAKVDKIKFNTPKLDLAAVAVATATDGVADASTIDAVAVSAKAKNNVAFSAGFGTSFELSSGMNLDVDYRFDHYGKTKKIENIGAKTIRAHIVTAGLRIDL